MPRDRPPPITDRVHSTAESCGQSVRPDFEIVTVRMPSRILLTCLVSFHCCSRTPRRFAGNCMFDHVADGVDMRPVSGSEPTQVPDGYTLLLT